MQDVWLRWQTTDRGVVHNPGAFLATTTTRLAINELQSARARRETYIGPWLPEPVDTSADPFLGAERGEALELVGQPVVQRARLPAHAAEHADRQHPACPSRRIGDERRTIPKHMAP